MDKERREYEKYARQKAVTYLTFVNRVRKMMKVLTIECLDLKMDIIKIKQANPGSCEALNTACEVYEERSDKLEELCKEYRRISLQADRLIASLKSHKYAAAFIYQHYLQDKPWREVCAENGVSYSWIVGDIRNAALVELYEKLCKLNAQNK